MNPSHPRDAISSTKPLCWQTSPTQWHPTAAVQVLISDSAQLTVVPYVCRRFRIDVMLLGISSRGVHPALMYSVLASSEASRVIVTAPARGHVAIKLLSSSNWDAAPPAAVAMRL